MRLANWLKDFFNTLSFNQKEFIKQCEAEGHCNQLTHALFNLKIIEYGLGYSKMFF